MEERLCQTSPWIGPTTERPFPALPLTFLRCPPIKTSYLTCASTSWSGSHIHRENLLNQHSLTIYSLEHQKYAISGIHSALLSTIST